jgi:uncharacterized protein (TIGR02594 family)
MADPYEIASTLIGKGEVPDQAAIQDFLQTGGVNLDPVTTAWCAAFVNASLGQAGMEGTGKLNARSFMDWGEGVDQPQRGDVAVFSRGDPSSGLGHVGFFDGYNPDGTIRVLGGNQGDKVSVANYTADNLLGFRRAPGENALASSQPDYTGRVNALRAGLDEPPKPQAPSLWAGLDPSMFMNRRG